MTLSLERQADQDLMAGVAASDENAINELRRRFYPLIRTMARDGLAATQDSLDVTEDSLVAVWRSASRYDAKRAALVTWVKTIAQHAIVDRRRRIQARIVTRPLGTPASIDPESVGPPVDARLVADDTAAEVGRRVRRLTTHQEEVLTLSYWRGWTLAQIASALGVPAGTIKSRLNRSLSSLSQIEAMTC